MASYQVPVLLGHQALCNYLLGADGNIVVGCLGGWRDHVLSQPAHPKDTAEPRVEHRRRMGSSPVSAIYRDLQHNLLPSHRDRAPSAWHLTSAVS